MKYTFYISAWLAILSVASICMGDESTGTSALNKQRFTPVVQVVRKASPAVVSIKSEIVVRYRNPFFDYDPFFGDFFERFFGPSPRYRKEQSLGSGFFISADGYLLTNEHVIMRSTKIAVMIHNGQRYQARVIGADPEHDLAVLKVKSDDPLPFLALGSSADLMIGETVIAIGNPFGLDHTVTVGVVSALHRTIRADDRVYRDFIQTDASINPGNSGGPLLNIVGEVIGINTAIYRGAEGIGFAIPSDIARRIVDDLIREGRYVPAWTGLEIQDVDAETLGITAKDQRVVPVVVEVWKDSPAENAGLAVGDVITHVEGNAVHSRSEVLAVLRDYTAGDRVRLRVIRDGKPLRFELKTTRFPRKRYRELLLKKLGVEVKKSRAGALITRVLPTGPLGRIGARAGDIIGEVNGRRVASPGDLAQEIAASINREAVTLLIIRRGFGYYISIEM